MMLLHALVALSFTIVHSEIAEDGDVLILKSSNFEEAISNNEYLLVEFYAPWCGHCNKLAPEYAEAASALKEEGSSIRLAKVDATEEKALAEEHKVEGYPTLKFFRNGKPIEYTGGRDASGIKEWCLRKTQPPLINLLSSDDVKGFISSASVAVIGFLKDTSVEFKSVLSAVSEDLDDHKFGLVTDSNIFKEYGVDSSEHIALFKKSDEGRADFNGPFTEEEITRFVKMESVPLVAEFSEETAKIVFSSPVKKHLVVFVGKSGGYEEAKADMGRLAKKFKGKAHFILINTDDEDHQRILEFFGLVKSDVPTYRAIDISEDMIKFKPETSEITADAMSSFIQGILDGTVKPFLMSQKEEDQNPDEPVKHLVGSVYNSFVHDHSKSVFVMLHAPWCGHCKQLAPIWDDLGEAFKNYNDVVIAKMDATQNEAENLSVKSFPTLKYYPKDSDEVVEYSGDRTLDKLTKFVMAGGKVDAAAEEDSEEQSRDEL